MSSFSQKDYFESLPDGYRFSQSDEFIQQYLKMQMIDEEMPPKHITYLNLYKYRPDTITEIYPELGRDEFYIVTPRSQKYLSPGMFPYRQEGQAGGCFWLVTGCDKPVTDNGKTFGYRKKLVFYEGIPFKVNTKTKKTDWIMYEYREREPPRSHKGFFDYVLCKVFEKTDSNASSSEDD